MANIFFARLMIAVLFLVNFAVPSPSMAANYALLIGISEYDESIGLPDLRGPSNDVALIQEVLAEHDFKVTVLSNSEPNGRRPNRTEILTALDDMTERAAQSDFVYLHFSGLGSQQLEANGTGMVNVFLPTDTARAATGSAAIPNAILEEEINARITLMRAKGADVWFVRDSCHTSPNLQAGSARVALRCVDPKVLGLDEAKLSDKQAATTANLSNKAAGRHLTFFAALPSEQAQEVQIDQADPTSWYGVLTSRLASRLQSGPATSYRQLFQALASDLDDMVLPGAARLQIPHWEGNLIDEAPFAGKGKAGPRQFPIDAGQLQAGLLQGLRDNMIVALVSDADAESGDILGHAQLIQTGLRHARLMGLMGPCVPKVSALCTKIGPMVDGATFARVVATPLDSIVRIAPPSDLSTGMPLDVAHPLHAALSQAVISSNAEDGLAFSLEPDAQILSGAHDGALWFGERLSTASEPMGMRWSPQDGPIEFVLRRIAQAEKLAGVLTHLSDRAPSLAPSPVDVQVTQRKADTTLAAQKTVTEQSAECSPVVHNTTVSSAPLSDRQDQQCDALKVIAEVTKDGPARDVNIVYIDSQYCVSASHQRLDSMAQPVDLELPEALCADCDHGDVAARKAGAERMFILVSEPATGSEPLNLEGIVDTCLSEGSRDHISLTADDFLAGLARQDATGSNLESAGVSSLWVKAFRWQVFPEGGRFLLADQ